MADATVTLKLTPAEFRLLRSAVEEAADLAALDGKRGDDPRKAREARERATLLVTLLERL